MSGKQWITPFLKQSFVTAGVSLNCAQFGVIGAYVMAIVPQLKKPGSPIPIDDNIGSWFASIHGLSILIGYTTVAKITNDYGRRVGNIISSGIGLVGWIFILLAENLTCLLIGRLLQGVSLGLCLALGPMMIAECTSPIHRGLFISTTTTSMAIGSTLIHYLGSFLHWKTTALVWTVVSFVDLLICVYSPESPSWLAMKGRYDDCKKIYRWLRGDDEEVELVKLIQVNIDANTKRKAEIKSDTIITYFKKETMNTVTTLKKREVYMPLIIGIHLYIMCYWSGLCVFASYPLELIHSTVGKNVETTYLILSFDIVRLLTSLAGLYVIKKINRRTMLFSSVGLNTIIIFVISGYEYAKEIYDLDIPTLSVIFLHLQIFFMSIGSLPLPTVICGEIFPLQHRSLTIAVTRLTSCIHLFAVYKSFPDLVRAVNIYGSYILFGCLLLYALVVCYFLLPETKDKTLQEIEDEFRGSAVKTDNSAEAFL